MMTIAKKLFLFVALFAALLGALPLRAELKNPTADILWFNSRRPYPGINESSFCITEPREMAVWMVRVDLDNPAIHLVTNRKPENWGEPMPDFSTMIVRTKRQTVGSFLLECRRKAAEGGRELPMVMAVNASPWGPWQKPFNHKYADGMGCMISDGELVCPANGRWCFCVPKTGKPFFRKIEAKDDVSDIWLSLPAFDRILANGDITVADEPGNLAPRTAYGLSADRRWLYILVVDGRQKGYSMGATIHELAQLLKLAGANEAVNMDGGGSTTLVFWDRKNGKPRMLNRPTKEGNYQRPVANCLGICLEEPRKK